MTHRIALVCAVAVPWGILSAACKPTADEAAPVPTGGPATEPTDLPTAGETGATGETGTVPGVRVTALLDPDHPPGAQRVLMIANERGTWVRTLELAGESELEVVGIPPGGSLTWAAWTGERALLATHANLVESGQVTFPMGPGGRTTPAGATIELTVPQHDRQGVTVVAGCHLLSNFPAPLSEVRPLRVGCLGAGDTIDAVAFVGGRVATSLEVAFLADLQPVGGSSPPRYEADLAWADSYGQARVAFQNPGDPEEREITLRSAAYRGTQRLGLPGEVSVLMFDEDEIGYGLPIVAHAGFHDLVVGSIAIGSPARGRRTYQVRRDLAEDGEPVTVLFDDLFDLPPEAPYMGVDVASRGAGLSVPPSWLCVDRAPNLGRLELTQSSATASTTWQLVSPYQPLLQLPGVDPALRDQLEVSGGEERLTVTAESIPGGYRVFRPQAVLWGTAEDRARTIQDGLRVCEHWVSGTLD